MENEKELVKDWIEKVVIGLNFCPFAAKPFNSDKIAYLIHIDEDITVLLKQFYAVLRELQEEPSEVLETAFIIYPHSFGDFDDYLSFVALLQTFLEKNQFEDEFQLASFHPAYQFEGSQPNDLSNVTNRSPFPLIHIIRSESIQQARLFYGDTLNIPEKNIANLNALGVDGWNSFCEDNQLPYLAKNKSSRFMNLAYRLQAFVSLGKILHENPERYDSILTKVYQHNPWFTIENQKLAISNVIEFFLNEQKLNEWVALYPHLKESDQPKEIGLILAGNIPLVGFHDFLCVLISGNIALIKCSDKDPFLLPFLAELLIELAPDFKNYIHFIDRLVDYDAVIATGSNNSSRYFEHYFSLKPHIIRKNRQAVAILNGDETPDDLMNLGKDIFTYFGLGCRNVSKIYVPQNYDFTLLLDQLHSFKEIILHNSYKNNFDYQSAIWLLNKVPHFMTGSVLVTEEKSISSKIATLHYEYYSSLTKLNEDLMASLEEIQCVVGMEPLIGMKVIPFGQAQTPTLSEYADGVDTMAFLVGLSFNSNTQI